MGEWKMKIAIYPGTFDPVTNGHLDVIKRSCLMFDKLIIGVTDDNNKKTLVSASSLTEKNKKKKKTEMSIEVANLLAKKALDKKITKVYFDRGRYKYHGSIKIFCDALRINGLNF